MLIQRLIELAARLPDIGPASYQKRAVKYQIVLDQGGRCYGIVSSFDLAAKATRRGQDRFIPDLVRTSGVRPLLLADKPSYVLGYRPPDAPPGREFEEHEAFKLLISECASATGESSVRAVQTFLDQFSLESLNQLLDDPTDFDPEGRMTFRVGDVLPIDLPSVRGFWADRCGRDEGSPVVECLSCGQLRPAVGVHPIPIKPLPGGQTSGNFVVSANEKAYESYGLAGSRTGPTCRVCAEAYGKSLNALLASDQSHMLVSGTAYAFWTEKPAAINWAPLIKSPEAAEVRALMRSAWSGKDAATEIDATAFYAVALGASGARVVIRDWIDTTVGEAKRHLVSYFALQEIVDAWGDSWEPLPLARIGNSTVRDPRKDAPPPLVPKSLMRLAFNGDPLPLDLLFLAVKRNRAAQDVTRERAMLIKMVLLSQPNVTTGEEQTMTDLERENTQPAYLCGRLLAVLDRVQTLAIGSPGASIVDKYYGAASSAPASVFGTLLHGAQNHMAKLRRDKAGAHFLLEEQLESIAVPLREFPKTLTLEQQGLFALGFYHQRASDRRAVKERAEARSKISDTEES